MAFGSTFGGVLGIASGWYGGKFDQVVQRIMDALMSIPGIILALAITASLGQSLFNIILAVGIVQIPRANRVVRSQVLAVKESQYVEGARAIGASNLRIMTSHITPQCVAPWLIIATGALGIAILTEAQLSFLGLGVQQPEPSWGGMLSGSASGPRLGMLNPYSMRPSLVLIAAYVPRARLDCKSGPSIAVSVGLARRANWRMLARKFNLSGRESCAPDQHSFC